MVSGSVWVASAPLVASEFNRFVPIAVGANLLIAPLLPIVMAAGFVCLVTAGLPLAICAPLGWLTGILFELLTLIVTRISSLPGSAFRVYALPTWWVVIWYVVVFLFLLTYVATQKDTGFVRITVCKSVRRKPAISLSAKTAYSLFSCLY